MPPCTEARFVANSSCDKCLDCLPKSAQLEKRNVSIIPQPATPGLIFVVGRPAGNHGKDCMPCHLTSPETIKVLRGFGLEGAVKGQQRKT